MKTGYSKEESFSECPKSGKSAAWAFSLADTRQSTVGCSFQKRVCRVRTYVSVQGSYFTHFGKTNQCFAKCW